MSSHKFIEHGLKWKFDFEKLQKISSNLDPNNPVVPVVVQDYNTKEVLILAYTNEFAFRESLRTGIATFWSTSRNELWIKGKTSGDMLELKEVRVNCEQNSLVYLVRPLGTGVCHVKDKNGKAMRTCYYRRVLWEKGKAPDVIKLQPLEDIELDIIEEEE